MSRISPNNNGDGVRILRIAQVCERTGLATSSIYSLIAQGTFPKPVPLSVNRVGWLEHELPTGSSSASLHGTGPKFSVVGVNPRLTVVRKPFGHLHNLNDCDHRTGRTPGIERRLA